MYLGQRVSVPRTVAYIYIYTRFFGRASRGLESLHRQILTIVVIIAVIGIVIVVIVVIIVMIIIIFFILISFSILARFIIVINTTGLMYIRLLLGRTWAASSALRPLVLALGGVLGRSSPLLVHSLPFLQTSWTFLSHDV
jgi:hypothetical protein